MLVSIINLGPAYKFSLVPLHNFVAGQLGSTGRDFRLPNSNYGTPGPRGCLRAYLLPMTRGVPFLATPPYMPTWHLSATGPVSDGPPVPSTLSRSLGPMAYSGRLVRCPGCPLLNTHLSTATLPAGQWTPAPFKKVSGLLPTPTTKRPPFGKFDEPTN